MPTPVIPQIKSLDILRKQLNAAFVALAGGSGVTSITAGSGLSGGVITATGTIALADTVVTPGSYTAANITVDAKGRLTAAANGSPGLAGVAIVDFGSGGGTDTSVAVADTGVVVGSTILASILAKISDDHSADEHIVEELQVMAGGISAGVGFNIYARTRNVKLRGKWNVAYQRI